MLPKQLLKQMVDFNKTAFENSFNAMVTLQEQMEKMAGAYMEDDGSFRRDKKSGL